jgi:hypothetical protein
MTLQNGLISRDFKLLHLIHSGDNSALWIKYCTGHYLACTEPDTIRLQLYSITAYHRMLSLSFVSNNCAHPCEQHPPISCDLCPIELGGTKVKPFIRCNNMSETFSLNWSCEMS